MRGIIAALAWIGCLGLALQEAQATPLYRTVALSGASGTTLGVGPHLTAGIEFSDLSDAVLNSSGQVAFRGTVAGTGVTSTNDTGIWVNLSGAPNVVAREGAAGPGPNVGAGVSFSSFISRPVLNDLGRVAFTANLTGSGINPGNANGLWSNVGGSLAVVARAGTGGPGPNAGPGVYFSTIFPYVQMNSSGNVAFAAVLTPNPTAANSHGIWSNITGTIAPVMLLGTEPPDTPGTTFNGAPGSPVGLNNLGSMPYLGAYSGASIGRGIWMRLPGGSVTLARSEVTGPGPNVEPGATFAFLNGPALNELNQIAFQATVQGPGIGLSNDGGIWTNTSGSLTVVAREGAAGPGPNVAAGVYFNGLDSPVLNSAGQMAFSGTVTGTGVVNANSRGIWSAAGGALTMVARSGDDLLGPNLGAGVQFNLLPNSGLQMNRWGEIAFSATLQGTGVTTSNDSGIWIWNRHQLTKVVREGDFFDVDPSPSITDYRTIASINPFGITNSGGEDGNPQLLNDDGLVVFSLVFTDGSRGVFTAQLPRQPGDFDFDGDVDGADFVAWQTNFPTAMGATLAQGDADADGDVDGADFVLWQTHFPVTPGPGAAPVPEPTAFILSFGAGTTIGWWRRRV
jgi:hypothetical protein